MLAWHLHICVLEHKKPAGMKLISTSTLDVGQVLWATCVLYFRLTGSMLTAVQDMMCERGNACLCSFALFLMGLTKCMLAGHFRGVMKEEPWQCKGEAWRGNAQQKGCAFQQQLYAACCRLGRAHGL